MTLTDFIKYKTNKTTGNTLENTGQCTGLVSVYMDELHIPHEWGHAKDFIVNANKDYVEVVKNTPTNIPQAGDIIVWGTKLGIYGHVAIFIEGDTNSFRSFDQNFPLGSLPHIQTHDYFGVLGWLHPKNPGNSTTTPAIPVNDQTKLDIGKGEIMEWQAIKSTVADLRTTVQVKTAALEDCNKQLDECLVNPHNTPISFSNPISQLLLAIAKQLG